MTAFQREFDHPDHVMSLFRGLLKGSPFPDRTLDIAVEISVITTLRGVWFAYQFAIDGCMQETELTWILHPPFVADR